MDESIKSHIERVREWLDEHVQVFSEPNMVRLSNFEVNWSNFSGSFQLSLDKTVLTNKIRFSLDASGKTTFYLPMYHSPLGAPASYAAIEITSRTSKAITSALHKTIPRIEAAGLNRETGKVITYHTPPSERISQEELEDAMRNVGSEYEISINVGSV